MLAMIQTTRDKGNNTGIIFLMEKEKSTLELRSNINPGKHSMEIPAPGVPAT